MPEPRDDLGTATLDEQIIEVTRECAMRERVYGGWVASGRMKVEDSRRQLQRMRAVLATLKAWEDPAYCKDKLGWDTPLGSIDRARMNVKGSSIAVGHPFAATGARIVANMAKLLDVNGGRGLISICTAGGMGVAAIMESAKAGDMRMAAE